MAGQWVEGVDNEVIGLVTAVAAALLTALAAYLWFRPAPARPRQQRIGRAPDADATCAICLGPVTAPVEVIPCGHIYCAECIAAYWNSTPRLTRMLCPLDRRPVDMILPSLAPDQHVGAETERTLRNYNAVYSGRGVGSWLRVGWTLGPRVLSNLGLLGTLRCLWVLVAYASFVAYLLMPFDILPEATFGVLGFIDDILVLLLIIVILGNVLRSVVVSNNRF
eukprot:m51a1_g2707 hypothetical protein (222) ;mRNA; f:816293-817054